MNTEKTLAEYAAIDEAEGELWESGALGRDPAHMRVADKKVSADLDDSLGLQMISIRLEKSLLKNLKEIAAHHNISYQPMIRDLLNRFASNEIKAILQGRIDEVTKMDLIEPVAPVREFMERKFG